MGSLQYPKEYSLYLMLWGTEERRSVPLTRKKGGTTRDLPFQLIQYWHVLTCDLTGRENLHFGVQANEESGTVTFWPTSVCAAVLFQSDALLRHNFNVVQENKPHSTTVVLCDNTSTTKNDAVSPSERSNTTGQYDRLSRSVYRSRRGRPLETAVVGTWRPIGHKSIAKTKLPVPSHT